MSADPAPPIASLVAAATRHLGRFACSRAMLRQHLTGRSDDAAAIETALDELTGRGLLDDRAYAAGRAMTALRLGWPRVRLEAELAARGVGPEDATASVATVEDDPGSFDIQAARAYVKRRRLRRARALAALARAGFDEATAERVASAHDEATGGGRGGKT